MKSSLPHRILVVGPSWVGDMVMAQPLLMRLHQHHPDLELDVLAPAWTLALLRRMPEVRRAIASPFGHGQLRVGERLRLARELRVERYHQAIVLPNSFKSALAPRFAGIPLRTGYVGEWRQLLLNDARALDAQALPLMVERFANLAEVPGIALPRPLPRPRLRVSMEAFAELRRRLDLDTTRPVVVLCPGAEYGPAKRWPVEHFAALGQRLHHYGYAVWLVGSPKDAAIAQQIAALDPSCRNLCGHTSLQDAIDLLAAAAVVVANDSGLMHVAAALDRPLVALYGSSSPSFTPPLSPLASVLKLDLPCSPCYKRQCPLGHFNCMRQLDPEQVFARIRQQPEKALAP